MAEKRILDLPDVGLIDPAYVVPVDTVGGTTKVTMSQLFSYFQSGGSVSLPIAWSDVSKVGAVPGDIGAAPTSHTHTWAQVDKAGAVPGDIGAAPTSHTHSEYQPLVLETVLTATRALALADANRLLTYNSVSNGSLTIPDNASVAFPVGTQLFFSTESTGTLTLAAGAGVTLRAAGNKLVLGTQYALASAIKTATNTWRVGGNLQ